MELSMERKSLGYRITKSLVISVIVVGVLYQAAFYLWGEHYLTFFKGIVRNPFQVGALSPCSRFVAQEITRHIEQDTSGKPLRILEVGAGSGVFTTQLEDILSKKGVGYTVDVIEIDQEYCKTLNERFKSNKQFVVRCVDVLQFTPEEPYDYIVSSLPFTNMPEDVVRNILDQYKTISKPETMLSFVEHIWLPDIKEFFLRGKEKEIYTAKRQMVRDFKNQFPHTTACVYTNITPLYVYHLTMDTKANS